MTGLIRTIGGDMPFAEAGPTYVHEHLIIDSPLVAETMPQIHLPSVEEAVTEVQACVTAGVRTMVDAMPAGSGRSPDRLSRVSILTGVRIVAATGLHTERYYEDVEWAREEGPDQLAERFMADIEKGMDLHDYLGDQVDRTALKAGIVKVATMGEELSDRDLRLFEAAAITHRATGVPVLTHTEGGVGGLAQVKRLHSLGVAPQRIALSHTDKVADHSYHRALMETGVFLCFDQAIRRPGPTGKLVITMLEAGFGDQILLGTDGARRTLWSTLGGSPGLAHLLHWSEETFDAGTVQRIMVDNPARYLSMGS